MYRPCVLHSLFLQTKQLSVLMEELQGFIDPFDMDVFRPYVAANLDRQLMRSMVSVEYVV